MPKGTWWVGTWCLTLNWSRPGVGGGPRPSGLTGGDRGSYHVAGKVFERSPLEDEGTRQNLARTGFER